MKKLYNKDMLINT